MSKACNRYNANSKGHDRIEFKIYHNQNIIQRIQKGAKTAVGSKLSLGSGYYLKPLPSAVEEGGAKEERLLLNLKGGLTALFYSFVVCTNNVLMTNITQK